MKVEIGQEWQHDSWKRTNGSCVIDYLFMGHAKGKVINYNFGSDSDGPGLSSDGTVRFKDNWKFLGIPIKCEDCGVFCNQKCVG